MVNLKEKMEKVFYRLYPNCILKAIFVYPWDGYNSVYYVDENNFRHVDFLSSCLNEDSYKNVANSELGLLQDMNTQKVKLLFMWYDSKAINGFEYNSTAWENASHV